MLIVPLRFGSGVRWKILEAMAMQRPVISTAKGAEGLEVTHGKNIWLEDDWSLLAQAIVRLWEGDREAKSIAQGGRRLIETHYDYRIYTPRVLQVYKNLLEK
jgi:glycosyltransferase involved in cell wall biosynthesis